MKRKILCALLLSALVCGIASCSGKTETTTTTTTTDAATADSGDTASAVSASDITAAVLAEITINSAFEKKQTSLPDYFDGLDIDTLTDSSYYICGSGAYPDEIAVFVFDSSASAEAAIPAVQARLEQQIKSYETYTPDEFYKLEDAVVEQSGNYVYYLVTSDNAKAENIVKGYIG